MIPRRFYVAVLLGLAVPLAAGGTPRRSTALPQKQREMLTQRVIPAHRLGNPTVLIQTLSPILPRLTEAQLKDANRLLADEGVPPIGELLADARLLLIHQQVENRLPLPRGRELLLTIHELHDRIRSSLNDQDAHVIMSDPLPQPGKLAEFKKLLWEVHVLDNRLSNAQHMAQYAARIRASAKFNPKLNQEAYREALAADFANLAEEIVRRRQDMEEREIALRIKRIHDASAILGVDGSSLRSTGDAEVEGYGESATGSAAPRTLSADRFLAAYVIGLDGDIVDEFFRTRANDKTTSFIREDLRRGELRTLVQQVVESAKQANGELVRKMQLLFVGLHWWSRGRYGAGTNAWGLLKSREALMSPEHQFPLFMPVSTPQPTNPADLSVRQVPRVDRRHHYTWATEHRPITEGVAPWTSVQKRGHGDFRRTGTQTTHLSRFY